MRKRPAAKPSLSPSTPATHTDPHWERAALIVIDMQRDFLDGGAAPIPGTAAIVANIHSLVQTFRVAGSPVVHVVRLYQPGSLDVDLPRRSRIEAGDLVVAPGTDGSQIVDLLAPSGASLDADVLLAGGEQAIGPAEVVLCKPRWSAFHRTKLEVRLRRWGCDTVVVTGCNLPNCPRATLFDASERDFRADLVTDAVSQSTPERVADLELIGVCLRATTKVITRIAGSHCDEM